MIRMLLLSGAASVSLASIAYMVHRISNGIARLTGSRKDKVAALSDQQPVGRVMSYAEYLERMSTLRPRDTEALVDELSSIVGDLRHSGAEDGSVEEVEIAILSDVVDPVLRMLEALRPEDPLPRDVSRAIQAATARVRALREQRRATRTEAASSEARYLLDRLRGRAA